MHAVIYLQCPAFDAHLVVSPFGVVVVIIVLVGIGAEVVVAGEEHGRSEEVAIHAVAVLRGKGYIEWVVLNVGAPEEGFAKVVQLHSITQLLASDVDGAAVGEPVLGIVEGIKAFAFVPYSVLADGCVAEVNGLACPAVAEKGGIALCVGLDYFVPHGEEVGTVLARCRVGFDDDAPQLVVYTGET